MPGPRAAAGRPAAHSEGKTKPGAPRPRALPARSRGKPRAASAHLPGCLQHPHALTGAADRARANNNADDTRRRPPFAAATRATETLTATHPQNRPDKPLAPNSPPHKPAACRRLTRACPCQRRAAGLPARAPASGVPQVYPRVSLPAACRRFTRACPCQRRAAGWVCRTLPCQAAGLRGCFRVFSSCRIRRVARLGSCLLWARRVSRRVLPSVALRAG